MGSKGASLDLDFGSDYLLGFLAGLGFVVDAKMGLGSGDVWATGLEESGVDGADSGWVLRRLESAVRFGCSGVSWAAVGMGVAAAASLSSLSSDPRHQKFMVVRVLEPEVILGKLQGGDMGWFEWRPCSVVDPPAPLLGPLVLG